MLEHVYSQHSSPPQSIGAATVIQSLTEKVSVCVCVLTCFVHMCMCVCVVTLVISRVYIEHEAVVSYRIARFFAGRNSSEARSVVLQKIFAVYIFAASNF